MGEIEQQILHVLVELEDAVKAARTANKKPDLLPIFARIDQLAARLESGTDPDLVHYLRRKSYEKARVWLEGRRGEIRAGSCGR